MGAVRLLLWDVSSPSLEVLCRRDLYTQECSASPGSSQALVPSSSCAAFQYTRLKLPLPIFAVSWWDCTVRVGDTFRGTPD